MSINKITPFWKNKTIFAIGTQTANQILDLDAKVNFVSNAKSANEFAYEIKDKIIGSTLYVRAKKVESNLFEILKNNDISIEEITTYETSCQNKKTKLSNNCVLIFTSPSTVKCFFNIYDWNETYKVVAIGKKTASFLPTNIEYKIPKIQSVKYCIELANTLI